MDKKELKRLNTKIKAMKKAAQELKDLSGTMPAVNRNVARILASIRMLEINVSDVLEIG